MKKLAIVGIVLSGVLMSAAIAQAKPVGMSKAEYRALVIRSDGLNQKYGVGQTAQQALIRERLGEIGLWALPSTSTVRSKPLSRPSQALIRERLGEIGLWALPSTSTVRSKPLSRPSQALIRERLGEIGLWALPSTSTVRSKPLSRPSQALIRERLGEIGLWALPSKPTARATSGSDGFDWNNAGLGVGLILGPVLLGLASVVTIRRHHRPVAH